MIKVDRTTHPELYDDYRKAVEYCKAIPDSSDRSAHFHVQWIGSDIGRMQLLTIKAFVTSQNENSKLTVWTDRGYDGPKFDRVEFKVFNYREEIKGTPFEGHKLNYWQTDIMRMVYLSKYGGVHIDMDTVLLRDLSPFLDQEFFYTWGFTEMIAGGVINLFKGSPVTTAICEAIIEGKNGLYRELFQYIRDKHNFSVWPCAWFNTEWAIMHHQIENDQHAQFIRSPVIKTDYSHEMYDGVFSWHWHNCWQSPIEDGSKWELMERRINERFKEKYG